MPEVKALKTFSGRLGVIRAGERFHCDPGYATALKRNGLVLVLEGGGDPGPERNRSIPEAPHRGGKGETGEQGNPPASPDPTQDGGKVLTSASLPAARASQTRTPLPSGAGKRKGKPTPRKPSVPPAA